MPVERVTLEQLIEIINLIDAIIHRAYIELNDLDGEIAHWYIRTTPVQITESSLQPGVDGFDLDQPLRQFCLIPPPSVKPADIYTLFRTTDPGRLNAKIMAGGGLFRKCEDAR
jgi:hypothetical protein